MPPTSMPLSTALLRALAVTTIVTGILVLLGIFTVPIRLTIVALLVLFAWRYRAVLRRSTTTITIRTGAIAVIAAAAAGIAMLAWVRTGEPIRSPWSIVPAPFALTVAIVAIATARGLRGATATVLALGSAVAVVTYRVGFGFDHFIHVAAERIIATTGALTPRPLFYSGHYGMVTLIASVSGISVDLIDRILVPMVVALFLTPYAARTFRSTGLGTTAAIAASVLLIVPFLPLAVSTPQALANTFTLAALLAVLAADDATAALAAGAALLSQPLSGIIAVTLVAGSWIRRRGWRPFAAATFAAGAVAIPIAFAVAVRIVPQLDVRVAFSPTIAAQHLGSALHTVFAIAAQDFATADALTIAHVLIPLMWITLACMGVRALTVRHYPERTTLIAAPLVALAAAAAVAATITIATQLANEQSQFPLRLVQLAALLATPLAGFGLANVAASARGFATRSTFAIVFGILATANVALAYPRDDAQERSGLWSVSASDLTAVHAIAADAGDQRYVVLANQMLGAAAIREFGFRPSYRVRTVGHAEFEILAFPLPAGGPIARSFWDFVDAPNPTRAPIDAAMELIHADRAYVVLHDYWRNYPRLVEATAAIADAELPAIAHLRVFRFERSLAP